MSEGINIRDLYTSLKSKSGQYSILDILVRLNDGIKKDHSSIILDLFWWHIFCTDRSLYSRLKSASNEAAMRQILEGRVRTSYVQGEKTIAVDSCMFPPEFLQIIGAYLEHTDELVNRR